MSHTIRTFNRSLSRPFTTIDRVFEELAEMAQDKIKIGGFPFHDIVKVDDNSLQFVFALAGYSKDEIDIEQQGDKLTVSAAKVSEDNSEKYIYRGISKSSFTRAFRLPQYAVIKGAEMKDGLLTIDINIEVPEERKPRKIEIVTASSETPAVKEEVKTED